MLNKIFNRVNQKKVNNEKEAVLEACMMIGKKYKANVKYLIFEGNKYIMVEAKEFTMLVTICKTNEKFCVKLEELLVEEEYRGKGIGTNIVEIMKKVCSKKGCTLGLWCRINDDKMFNFYSRLGFKHTETLNDKWMEWN